MYAHWSNTCTDYAHSQVSSCARPILSLARPRVKHLAKPKRGPDTRRNLYVLNVPHDLSA
jgi:hypothetical protein